MVRAAPLFLTLIAVLGLAACEQEPQLAGERLDVRAPLPDALPATNEGAAEIARINAAAPAPDDPDLRLTRAPSVVATDVPIRLPAQAVNASWTHRAGGPQHRITHPALNSRLTPIWSTRIGEGNSRRARITADPVVGNNRVFTLDARSLVSAHNTGGALLWQRDLTRAGERTKDASGGGLALSGNRLYVSTGFGEMHALDAASGAVIWTQEFDASISGAPTVYGDLIYVVSRDSHAFAVRTDNGRIAWQLPGAPTGSLTVDGAGPAVTDKAVVFPFGSAQMVAALRQGGVRTWSVTLAGKRRGRAYAGVTDITADPVIVGDTVYAGSPAGTTAAVSLTTGERLWTASEGALSPVVPAGGSLFLVSDQGQLVRLNASDGSVIWATDMPFFTKEKARRRLGVVPHFGPILAGGRLYVGSGDESLRAFDPQNGQLVARYELQGGAASNPVVAGRVLYILSGRGQLHAFR